MSSALEKSFAIIELMVGYPQGIQVSEIARRLDLPVSGVHRQLKELARLGYVRQAKDQGDYALTIRLAALGLGYLGRSGVTDVSQSILDRLAAQSGELVRLSVLDVQGLTWVAFAQGATVGLRYDPGREQGQVVHPASTAGGRALLSTMNDADILEMVGETGLVPKGMPPTSSKLGTIQDLLETISSTRTCGYAVAIDSYIEGMAAMAVALRAGGQINGQVIGCVSIAGPAVRFTPERIAELAPSLNEAADELGKAASASSFFKGILNG